MRAAKETAEPAFLQTIRQDPFPGLPKYLHFRETLLTAIEGGHWKPCTLGLMPKWEERAKK